MVQFFRSFEAPINITQTLTDGTFTSNVLGPVVGEIDHITFSKSRVVNDTVFVMVGVQTAVESGSNPWILKFAIVDVTDGVSFPTINAYSPLVSIGSLSNSVMPVARFPNFTRYLVMNMFSS